ncbi:MAG: thiamine-phosphate kinase, partial [Haloplanus sp.]
DENERRELSTYLGEDFELVFTGPATAVDAVRESIGIRISRIGTVADDGVRADGDPLPDRGYSH